VSQSCGSNWPLLPATNNPKSINISTKKEICPTPNSSIIAWCVASIQYFFNVDIEISAVGPQTWLKDTAMHKTTFGACGRPAITSLCLIGIASRIARIMWRAAHLLTAFEVISSARRASPLDAATLLEISRSALCSTMFLPRRCSSIARISASLYVANTSSQGDYMSITSENKFFAKPIGTMKNNYLHDQSHKYEIIIMLILPH